ncbi:molybdopterin-dependent oxidoreductase [Egicoccus sp. AB-alg2]|uniref:molybdopterin-dependent oxidoreductase n=1 Tax=Egicoccus sp. AB-alg2 TaxID=3242693 RepID=UPI00359E2FD4
MTIDTSASTSGTGASPSATSPAPRWLGAVAGVLAASAALGAGELVAGLRAGWPSPVVAIADRIVEASPPALTSWAIGTFGTNDKPLLIAGIGTVLAVLAALLGVLATRRPFGAAAGVAGLGTVGVAAGLNAPGTGAGAGVPGVAATFVGVGALLALAAGLARYGDTSAASDEAGDLGRRRFLVVAGTVAAGAMAMGTAGRLLLSRFDVEAARDALALPAPVARRDLPPPAGAELAVDGITPLITPNDAFYRIDTALAVPRIDPDTHVLRVTGMVERPLTIPFADLLRRDLVEVPITMTCVSNEVGGDLVGNAVWLGFRLRELLDEVGVSSEADQVVGRSVDGYTGGFPVAAAYDRDALVVVGMNGEPLPAQHGFPLRLVTPGLYGYVGSTKWLAEIELTRFDRFDHYWVPRGYAAQAPVKTMARIDVPGGRDELAPGERPIAGVAWAQSRGVANVEVQVDDGAWQTAELAEAVNDVSWRPWVLSWRATPGRHRIRVRATDGDGVTQPETRTGVRPDGATGWHTITVLVTG